MAVKVKMTLGKNTLEVDGDFAFDAPFAAVVGQWINAQADGGHELEALTTQLERQNAEEAAAVVNAGTPPIPSGG